MMARTDGPVGDQGADDVESDSHDPKPPRELPHRLAEPRGPLLWREHAGSGALVFAYTFIEEAKTNW